MNNGQLSQDIASTIETRCRPESLEDLGDDDRDNRDILFSFQGCFEPFDIGCRDSVEVIAPLQNPYDPENSTSRDGRKSWGRTDQ